MSAQDQLCLLLPSTLGHNFGDVSSFVPDGTYHGRPLLPTDKSVGYFLSPCRAGDMTLNLYPPALSEFTGLKTPDLVETG